MKNWKTSILFIAFCCTSTNIYADISQNQWWLANNKNNSVAQYQLAIAYNPLSENDSWHCNSDEFYLRGSSNTAGECKEKSAEKYIEWLTKSANNLYPLAQKDLGIAYAEGKLVGKDIPTALSWLEKAAGPISKDTNFQVGEGTLWLKKEGLVKGVGEAHYILGVLYDEGIDVKADYSKAIKYYEMASNSYDWGFYNIAQYRLATLYSDKIHDPKKAIYWLERTANNIGQFAYKRTLNVPLKIVDFYLKGGQPDGTIVTSSPNYPWAAQWLLKISQNTDIPRDVRAQAYIQLGWFYLQGLGVEQNMESAAAFYIKGLYDYDASTEVAQNKILLQDTFLKQFIIPAYQNELNIDTATEVLNTVFENHPTQEKLFLTNFINQIDEIRTRYSSYSDYPDSRLSTLFLLAQKRDIAYGYYRDAQMITGKKANKITELYQKALELEPNNAQILYAMGTHYDFILQEPSQAIAYYQKAADLSYKQANYRLGVLYYLGRGVTQDYKAAWRLLDLAAQEGYIAAQDFMLSISSSHPDVNWLKQQYSAHSQVYRSPSVFVDGKDWLVKLDEEDPTAMVTYHRLMHESQKQDSLSSYALCKAALAYAAEGDIKTQQLFIDQIKPREYFFRCKPNDDAQLIAWIENSDKLDEEKHYLEALFYGMINQKEKSKEMIDQLVKQNNPYAIIYVASSLLYGSFSEQQQGFNYIKSQLKLGNIDAAELLILYYQENCCSSDKNPMEDYYQYDKAILLRNDLAGIYSRSASYLRYAPQEQQYIFADTRLSQSQIYKMWFELASQYEIGNDVPKNDVMAYVWYSLLAEYNQPNASDKAKTIQATLSAEQLIEADKKLERHRDVYRFYPLTYIEN